MATGELTRRRPRLPALPSWGRGARHRGNEVDVATAQVELAPAIAILRWSMLALSGLAIWLVLFAFVLSPLQQHRAQHTLYAEFRQKLAEPNARIGVDQQGKAIPLGEPVAIVRAPVIGLDQVVVEGTGSAQTRSGPGHLPNTSLPGQYGTSRIFGRSVLYGAPFASIDKLQLNDEIRVVTGQGRFVYQVLAIVRPHDKLPAYPASGSEIWLQTSESHGWRSGWAPSSTVTVVAGLVTPKTAAPPPTGPQGQSVSQVPVSSSEQPMQGDSSGLFATVIWLQGLLLAALTFVWAVRRWGPWQAATVGVVVLAALLWGATNSAALLVPNLF